MVTLIVILALALAVFALFILVAAGRMSGLCSQMEAQGKFPHPSRPVTHRSIGRPEVW